MITEHDSTFLIATFHLGRTLWGVDTSDIREVIRIPTITLVPKAPEYVVGIINLRGRIVTIIDLRKKLGFDPEEMTSLNRIIIVEWENEFVGLLVDELSDVHTVTSDQLSPPPSTLNGTRGEYITGVLQSESGLVAVLRIGEVLAIREESL